MGRRKDHYGGRQAGQLSVSIRGFIQRERMSLESERDISIRALEAARMTKKKIMCPYICLQ